MDQRPVLDEIIISYRKLIEERYQYENLKSKYDIPSSFSKDKVDDFHQYFLEHIYPDTKKREALNDAFQNLDLYIKKPEKLLRIIMDSARLIFKHGRHLPKILATGIKALKSFRAANQFEISLSKIAASSNHLTPYSTDTMNEFISQLPKEEIDAFIESSESLFETLHDRKLVKKILEVVTSLVEKMEQSSGHYTKEEIEALKLGQQLIATGNELFEELSDDDQKSIISFVIQVEKDNLKQIFNK